MLAVDVDDPKIVKKSLRSIQMELHPDKCDPSLFDRRYCTAMWIRIQAGLEDPYKDLGPAPHKIIVNPISEYMTVEELQELEE